MARMIANRMPVGARLVRAHANPGAGKRRPSGKGKNHHALAKYRHSRANP